MTSKVIEGHKSSSNFSMNPTLPSLDGPLMLPAPNCVDISLSFSLSLFLSPKVPLLLLLMQIYGLFHFQFSKAILAQKYFFLPWIFHFRSYILESNQLICTCTLYNVKCRGIIGICPSVPDENISAHPPSHYSSSKNLICPWWKIPVQCTYKPLIFLWQHNVRTSYVLLMQYTVQTYCIYTAY